MDVNSYMLEWQRKDRRKKRVKEGRSKYVHSYEVPDHIGNQIVGMRDSGKTWAQIANAFSFTRYLVKKVYQDRALRND